MVRKSSSRKQNAATKPRRKSARAKRSLLSRLKFW